MANNNTAPQHAVKVPHIKSGTAALEQRLKQHNIAARQPMTLTYGPRHTATPSQRQYTVDITKNGLTQREIFKTEAAWLRQLNYVRQHTDLYDAKIIAIDLIAGRPE